MANIKISRPTGVNQFALCEVAAKRSFLIARCLSGMEKPLTEEDWGELQNVLYGRDFKWQAIGIQLHVAHDELTRIKEEHGQNLEECNREMQIAWLKSGTATWRALVAALGAGPVGLLEDAKRLEKHLGVRIIQSAASASGSHGDLVECNSESKFCQICPSV